MNYNDDHFRTINEYKGVYPIKIRIHSRPLARIANLARELLQKQQIFSFISFPDSSIIYCDYILDLTLSFGENPNLKEIEVRTLGHSIDKVLLKNSANRLGALFLSDELD